MRKFAIIGCGRIAERHALQISLMAKLVLIDNSDGGLKPLEIIDIIFEEV